MVSYFIEPRIRKYLKWHGLLPFESNLCDKYWKKKKKKKKKKLDTATKTGLYAPKTIPKKVAH